MLRKIFTTSKLYGSNGPGIGQLLPRLSVLLATLPVVAYFILATHQEFVSDLRGSVTSIDKLLSAAIAIYLVIAGLVSLALGVYFIAQTITELKARRIIKRRLYLGQLDLETDDYITQSAVYLEMKTSSLGVFDLSTELVKQLDYWRIYDASFNCHSRQGVYRTYRTVYEARLSKPVPHLVFDSKAIKTWQFKRVYLKGQKLDLGLKFADYFSGYSAINCPADCLSFLTPSVLEAIIALGKCDIEILADRLLCYAPLTSTKKLDDFETRCQNLHQLLNDGLSSYQISQPKASAVGQFASRLRQDPVRWLMSIVTYLPLVGLAVLAVRDNLTSNTSMVEGLVVNGPLVEASAFLIAGMLGFGHATYKFLSVSHYNKHLSRELEDLRRPAAEDSGAV